MYRCRIRENIFNSPPRQPTFSPRKSWGGYGYYRYDRRDTCTVCEGKGLIFENARIAPRFTPRLPEQPQWHDSLVEPIAGDYHFFTMAHRPGSGRQSYSIAVLVVLLLTATGVALLHWHKDWTPQDCQLCHIRDFPTADTHVVTDFTVSVVAELQWQVDDTTYYLNGFSLTRASRAPPQFTFITV